MLVVVGLAAACATTERTDIGTCAIRPGANCAGNYMKGSRLAYSILSGAKLDFADLTKANLAWSSLAGARMRRAVLERANLVGAQLGYRSEERRVGKEGIAGGRSVV